MVKKKRVGHWRPRNLDRFLFRATGKLDRDETVPLDVFDNLIVELDRLATVAVLLETTTEPLETRHLHGLAGLIRDVEERTREILELAHPRPGKSMSAS